MDTLGHWEAGPRVSANERVGSLGAAEGRGRGADWWRRQLDRSYLSVHGRRRNLFARQSARPGPIGTYISWWNAIRVGAGRPRLAARRGRRRRWCCGGALGGGRGRRRRRRRPRVAHKMVSVGLPTWGAAACGWRVSFHVFFLILYSLLYKIRISFSARGLPCYVRETSLFRGASGHVASQLC